MRLQKGRKHQGVLWAGAIYNLASGPQAPGYRFEIQSLHIMMHVAKCMSTILLHTSKVKKKRDSSKF